MNSVRSYANSYLYTRIPDYERSVFEFVMKADRIDKNADTFTGVIEDVKRRQTSAVLSRVLMRDDVVLCVNNKPLPASFKVFAAKDVRTDQSVKVFIDLSGLITLKNGYYVINKIDIFCSYLLSAMTNIIYNENMTKICSNSMIIQSGTECFVNLSSHIFDYLRANGYSENKNKIAYIFAMYFQCTILGLDRDSSSVKALAAKIADIPSRDINAMELYYDDSVLTNINTLVTCVTDTFKMKGVGTDTFVEKWTWFYGVGTQFGTELFPAFASMITDAYCGAYVNNQKTIEKCCGKAMVNFTTAMLKIGSDTIEVGFRYESTIDREMYDHNRTVLQEGLFSGAKAGKAANNIKEADFIGSASALKKKVKDSVEGLTASEASNTAKIIYFGASATTDKYILGDLTGYKGMIENTVAAVKPYLNQKDKDAVIDELNKSVINMTKMIKNNDPIIKNMTESKKLLAGCKAGLKMLDPNNAALKEHAVSFEKEIDKALQESINEINSITLYNDSINTDFNILEDYLTEGIISAFSSAIKAIFDAVRNFFNGIFGKTEEKCKENVDKADEKVKKSSNWMAEFGAIGFKSKAVTDRFLELYKTVKVKPEDNPDTHFIDSIQKRLDTLYDKAKTDIESIKNDYHSGYTESDLDNLKSKIDDVKNKAKDNIKELTGVAIIDLYPKKQSEYCDEEVINVANGTRVKRDIDDIKKRFDSTTNKIESLSQKADIGNQNDESSDELYKKVEESVSGGVKDVVSSYASAIEKLGSTAVNGYTIYQMGCQSIAMKVLNDSNKGQYGTKDDATHAFLDPELGEWHTEEEVNSGKLPKDVMDRLELHPFGTKEESS